MAEILSNAVGGDFWVEKYDSSGREDTNDWSVGVGTTYRDIPYSLAVGPQDNVFLASMADAPRFQSDLGKIYLAKFLDSPGF